MCTPEPFLNSGVSLMVSRGITTRAQVQPIEKCVCLQFSMSNDYSCTPDEDAFWPLCVRHIYYRPLDVARLTHSNMAVHTERRHLCLEPQRVLTVAGDIGSSV
jgi:hypothetical protein